MFSCMFIIVALAAGILIGAYAISYFVVRKGGKVAMWIMGGFSGMYVVELISSVFSLARDGVIAIDPVTYIGVIIFMFAVYGVCVYGMINGYKKRDWD